ncbi:hypothetical protein SCLCIDRAFT_739627 [Scleroderma citrinum Foug A]|uniref:Uncharacterized protein n=1 Tax=Scleroderma citrinum Foug A TaxID=1036808 RepID=A0A0C3D3F3_9AGAM|nr:hypothetical protein SCLCIDRAFT_739627 [Scleroderma citrinum Foug A]
MSTGCGAIGRSIVSRPIAQKRWTGRHPFCANDFAGRYMAIRSRGSCHFLVYPRIGRYHRASCGSGSQSPQDEELRNRHIFY